MKHQDLNKWAATFMGEDPEDIMQFGEMGLFTESTSVAMSLVDTLVKRGYDVAIITVNTIACVSVQDSSGKRLSQSIKPRDRMAEAIVEAIRGAMGNDAGRQGKGEGEAAPAAVPGTG